MGLRIGIGLLWLTKNPDKSIMGIINNGFKVIATSFVGNKVPPIIPRPEPVSTKIIEYE